MKISVMDRWAAITRDDTLRQNAQKPYEVEFVFSEHWEGYSKTAVFEAGPVNAAVALTEDRCTIPMECLKHGSVRLHIGVYGTKGEERKETVWCHGSSMIIPDATLNVGDSLGMPTDHRQLANRDAADQHPIKAISGLEQELNRISKPVEALTNAELEEVLK